jgi:tetrahydromethanopterin S-methyltransferase subunit D
MVVTGIFELLSFGLMFTDLFDKHRHTLPGSALASGLIGSWLGGFAGALIAALFARNRSSRRLRIGKWVILGNVIGLLLGAYFAAAVEIITAGIVGIDEFRKNPNFLYLPLGGGLIGGMLAGILAAACSTLSMRQSGRV